MKIRTVALFGAALSIAVFIGLHRGNDVRNIEGDGVVFVYFPSQCAKAGDPSDCHEIKQYIRPSFPTQVDCLKHADIDLSEANDPARLGSCLKQRES